MNFKEIKALIAEGESRTIEYKKSIAELEKLGKSICGMLNTKGGYGFIGITDSGKIIGTEVSDSTKKKLTEFCNHFDPWPNLEIDYILLPNSNKYIIVFACKFSRENGPYTFKGRPYVKTESGVELMSSEKYKQLLLENAGLSKAWEAMYANHYTIDDLDHNEIIKTIKIGLKEERVPEEEYTEDIADILTHFDLIQGNKLNNAAMILFAKKIPADYSQCFIRMGRFIDETMDDVLDSKQIRGNAFQLLSEAQDFVRRHIPIASRHDVNQFERIDEAAIPLLALREALINAICHRDYSKRSGDISLFIFNDHLEIHNAGHLYAGLTIDQLTHRHPSRRRNERIAQIFFARKLIDRWGGGTRRILRLCAAQALPAPIFSEDGDGFLVKFFFKEPIGPQKIISSEKIHIELTERQQELMNILLDYKKLGFKEIVRLMKNPPSERTIRNDLVELRDKGLLVSEGLGRAAVWYRIRQ